jgi:tRNA(fMet)-specific endonuclease VapC
VYLLDSNICIAIINQNPVVLTEVNLKSNQCCISTIVMAELYKSVYFSQRIEQNLQTLKLFINSVEVIDFDKNAAEEFGKIQLELK